MSLNETIIVTILTVIFQTAYNSLVPKVVKEVDFYEKIINENKFINQYYRGLERILELLSCHFGKPFSKQSFLLNTNLAVAYSFAVFLLIYIFTGEGRLGSLHVLYEDIAPSIRFFIFVVCVLYYLFLFRSFRSFMKNKRLKISNTRKVFLIVLTLFPSLLISLIVSLEWNAVVGEIPIIIKTIAIISLSTTLSAAILGFSGYGKGTEEGYGQLVFNITFLSLVGVSAVFSTFFQIEKYGVKSFFALLLFVSLCYTSLFLWKKKINLYYFNIFLVMLYIVIRNRVPGIFGMDLISSSLLYFFVALPFINGSLDFVSLSISRKLANIIKREKGNLTILVSHIMIDFLLAFILLCLLIIFFTFITTEIFNEFLVTEGETFVSIQMIFVNAIKCPLSANALWLYAMMFSTLLPTFIHLVLGVSSLIFLLFGFLGKSLVGISGQKKNKKGMLLFWYVQIARFGAIFLTFIVIVNIIDKLGPLFLEWIQLVVDFITSLW